MKASTINELKGELKDLTHEEVMDLCLCLAKFKKENKELITYRLIESYDEDAYIAGIKEECDGMFSEINRSSYYYIKKSIRKILRHIKKHTRYSDEKSTELELLLFFCERLMNFEPNLGNSSPMRSLFDRQVNTCRRLLKTLHEDLQFDYRDRVQSLRLTPD